MAARNLDDKTTAVYAGTCLTGTASQWAAGLNDETQQSWELLRQAFLRRFRPASFENIPHTPDFSPLSSLLSDPPLPRSENPQAR